MEKIQILLLYSYSSSTRGKEEVLREENKERGRKKKWQGEVRESKKEDQAAAASGWIPFSCSVREGDPLSITKPS